MQPRGPAARARVTPRLIAARLEGELEREDFRRHGWESALNARAIFAFWEEMQPGLFEELPELPPAAAASPTAADLMREAEAAARRADELGCLK